MLLIKTHIGHGVWDLREADTGLKHLGSHNLIGVKAPGADADSESDFPSEAGGYWLDPVTQTPMSADTYDFWRDERFPTDGVEELHIFVLNSDAGGKHDDDGPLLRWVRYTDPNDHRTQMVIANTPIFICNERGDTIESLRC